MLGRSLRWTKEGLGHEASDKHRQVLLEGLGLTGESKTFNSAAVKEEDANMLDEAERMKFRSLVATLNYMSLGKSDVQHGSKEICTKMANPTQELEEAEEGSQTLGRSGERDVGDAGMKTRRGEG